MVLRTFSRKPRPDSGLDCLVCAILARPLTTHGCMGVVQRSFVIFGESVPFSAKSCQKKRPNGSNNSLELTLDEKLQTAAEQGGNNLKGVADFHLKAKGRIWPRLAYVFQVRSTAVPVRTPRPLKLLACSDSLGGGGGSALGHVEKPGESEGTDAHLTRRRARGRSIPPAPYGYGVYPGCIPTTLFLLPWT